jgi:hypothetical protein
VVRAAAEEKPASKTINVDRGEAPPGTKSHGALRCRDCQVSAIRENDAAATRREGGDHASLSGVGTSTCCGRNPRPSGRGKTLTKPHTRENPCRSTPSKSAGPGGDGLKDWLSSETSRPFGGKPAEGRRHFILASVTGHQKGLRSAVGKGDPPRPPEASRPDCHRAGHSGRRRPIFRARAPCRARGPDALTEYGHSRRTADFVRLDRNLPLGRHPRSPKVLMT